VTGIKGEGKMVVGEIQTQHKNWGGEKMKERAKAPCTEEWKWELKRPRRN